MKALIVYDSHFGYTEKIARAIQDALTPTVDVDIVHVGAPGSHLLGGHDLLIVGGPTEGHGVTLPMREWLDRVGAGTLAGVPFAAFDTRVAWPKLLSGSAAGQIAKHLQTAGGHPLAEPESFIVHGKENPDPDAAALDQVHAWVMRLLAAMPAPVG